MGIRIDHQANRTDPTPATLVANADSDAALASDGAGWLLATRHLMPLAAFYRLHFYLVAPDGRTTSDTGIALEGREASIAYSGSAYVVAYMRVAALRIAVISRDGRLLNDMEVFDSEVGNYSVVATKPGRVVLLFHRGGLVHAAGVDVQALADGTATFGAAVTFGPGYAPTAAWNGSELLVLWSGPDDTTIRGARVTAAGVTPSFTLPQPGRFVVQPVAVGSNWLVSYAASDGTNHFLLLLDGNGQTISGETMTQFTSNALIAPAGGTPAIISIWKPILAREIVARPVRTSPIVLSGEPVTLSVGHAAQSDLHLARCGGDTLAVWREQSRVDRIVFRRFAATGAPKGAPVIVEESFKTAETPRIACTDDSTMLVWLGPPETLRHIRAAVLDAHDVPSTAFEAGYTDRYSEPSIASNGRDYVLAAPNGTQLVFSRWRKDGSPIITGPLVLYAANVEEGFSAVALSADGDGYLAVIERTYQTLGSGQIISVVPVVTLIRHRLQALHLNSNFIIDSNSVDVTERPAREWVTPPFFYDGPDVSGMSVACAATCAVPRLQSNKVDVPFVPFVTRLDKRPQLLGPTDGVAVPVPLPLRPTVLAPYALWSGSRLIVAADSTLAEVHSDGTAEALTIFPDDEHAVGVMDTPSGLATFLQKDEEPTAAPRLYLRIPSARRRAAR